MSDHEQEPVDDSTDTDSTDDEKTGEITPETVQALLDRLDAQDEQIAKLSRRRTAKPKAGGKKGEEDDADDPVRKELEETRAKLDRMQRKTRRQIAISAADKARAVDGEAVAALIDFDALEDPDDDDEIKDAVKQILKDRPALVKRVRSGAAEGGDDGGKGGEETDMNVIIRERLGKRTA